MGDMKWISVKDQLPEECEDVLVFNPKKRNRIALAYFVVRENGEIFWSYDGTSGGSPEMQKKRVPTHWMELPEPPNQ